MGTIVTTSIGTFVTSRRKEIALLVGVLVGTFALVSMVGFRESDPTLLRPGSGVIENPCGWVGANLADLLFTGLGLGAWALVLLVAISIVSLAGRQVMGVWQWIGSVAIYLLVLGGMELAVSGAEPHATGGLIGAAIGQGLQVVVGYVGAWLLLVGATVLLGTVVSRLRWTALAATIVGHTERLSPIVGRTAWGWLKASVGWFWGMLKAIGAWTWRGTGSAGLWSFRQVGVAGDRGVGVAARMWSALRRGNGSTGEVDEAWEEDDGSWEESVLSDVHATEGDDPTVVGAGARALAEVEWEPTMASEAASDDVLELFPDFAPRQTSSIAHIAAERSQVHSAFAAAGSPVPVERDDASVVQRRSVAPASVAARAVVAQSVAVGPSENFVPSVPSVPSVALPARDATPVAPPRPAGTRRAVSTNATNGPGVEVLHNAFLDLHNTDDGEALREEACFELPPLSLLDEVPEQNSAFDKSELRAMALTLEEKLATFNVRGKCTGVRPGPVVTIFEFLPEPGIKVSKIAGLSDDLAMALKALRVRIVAPIPGRGVVGIEIPSKNRLTIFLREVLASPEFRDTKAALPCVLGKDVEGRPVVADLARMPHLLIGGTTGSGKSVGVNGMLMSLLFTLSPDEMRMLLVDPKMLEFEMYSDIPHLLHPVVTDAKIANQALAWACREMDARYELLARWSTRNIVNYNNKIERELKNWTREKARKYAPKDWTSSEDLPTPEKLPYIVIVVDELADLMMVAGKEVEESICRIAQKARACGIHLIVATQRPSVDVVTGLIKANLPTRISFQLRSRHDSRTVLDEIGAENLLGRGDMLYLPPGVGGVVRCHGAFVSDEEVGRVTSHLRAQERPRFIEDLATPVEQGDASAFDAEMQDELYDAAVNVIMQNGKASTSMIQRHLKIGYNRAARIIDAMEAAGLIGPADGARPREVLVGQL